MTKQHIKGRFALLARLAIIAIIVATASGCAATDWLTGKSPPDTDENVILGAPTADEYLSELNELVTGDAHKQADIFDDASSSSQLTPGPTTNLRLGLIMATPGHPETNPAEAQLLLRGVLDQSELMTTSEVALATIALNNVTNSIMSTSRAASLQASTSQAAKYEEQALSQRLVTTEAENARLREALADAEQKLEAITSIERSIREQE